MNQSKSPTELDNRSISVGSWNVLAQSYARSDRYLHSPVGWSGAHRPLRVANIVCEYLTRCDVLCLQEVDSAMRDAIYDLLGGASSHFAPHQSRSDGTMLISRHVLENPVVLTSGNMSATTAQLKHPLGNVTVVSAHLEWNPDPNQAKSCLIELLKEIHQLTDENVILAMDANTAPDSESMSPLTLSGWSVTPPHPTAYMQDRGWISLDLVASRFSKVHLVEIKGGTEVIPSKLWPSDHCLVLAEVKSSASEHL